MADRESEERKRGEALRVLFAGATCEDNHTWDHIRVRATDRGLAYHDPNTEQRAVFEAIGRLLPGAKLTATQVIDGQLPESMVRFKRSGGAPHNQSVRFAEHAAGCGVNVRVSLLDTSPDNGCVRKACEQLGIELRSLACHNLPVSIVSKYQGDKSILRSPIVANAMGQTNGRSRDILEAAGEADVAVCASPKDARVALQLWASTSARRYLQPTGTLTPVDTLSLVRQSFGSASTVGELCLYARSQGINTADIDEASPRAAEESFRLLAHLKAKGALPSRVAAVTFGRQGCAIVDFPTRKAYAISLDTDSDVATPSGAGDYWLAMWIYYREVADLREPFAAIKATKTVALGIGVPEDSLTVRTLDFPFPPRDSLSGLTRKLEPR